MPAMHTRTIQIAGLDPIHIVSAGWIHPDDDFAKMFPPMLRITLSDPVELPGVAVGYSLDYVIGCAALPEEDCFEADSLEWERRAFSARLLKITDDGRQLFFDSVVAAG
jgi:hypothetical protein